MILGIPLLSVTISPLPFLVFFESSLFLSQLVYLNVSILSLKSGECSKVLKNMYSATFGWNVLFRTFGSVWPKVQFSSSVFFVMFCLDDLPIFEIDVLKSPSNIVLLFTFPFRSFNICFVYLGGLMSGV